MLITNHHLQKCKYEKEEVVNVLKLLPSLDHLTKEDIIKYLDSASYGREIYYEINSLGNKQIISYVDRVSPYHHWMIKEMLEGTGGATKIYLGIFYSLEHDDFYFLINEYGFQCLECRELKFEEKERFQGYISMITASYRKKLCGHYLNNIPLLCNDCAKSLDHFAEKNDTLETVILRKLAFDLQKQCRIMRKEIRKDALEVHQKK